MDLQLGLIYTVIVVVLALLVYFISIFGVKEKTYEEAIAEQRRRTDESWFQTKTEKVPKSSRNKKKKEEKNDQAKRKNEKAAKEKQKTTPRNVSPPSHSTENHTNHVDIIKTQSEIIGEGTKEKKQKLIKNSQVKNVPTEREDNVVEAVSRKRPHSQIGNESNLKIEIDSKHVRDKKEQKKIEIDFKNVRDKKDKDKAETNLKPVRDKKEQSKNEISVKNVVNKKEQPTKNEIAMTINVLGKKEQPKNDILKNIIDKKEQPKNDVLKNVHSKKEQHKNEIAIKGGDNKEQVISLKIVHDKKEQPKNENVLKNVRDKKESKSDEHVREKKESPKIPKQEKTNQEVFLKKEENRSESSKKKQEKVSKGDRKMEDSKQFEEEPLILPHLVNPISIPVKKQKKIKSENSGLHNEDDTLLHNGRWQELLKTTTLSDAEIQSLIEVLLNKQHGAEWTKKGQKIDPVTTLKKQLQETESSLAEHKQLSQTASTKLKELRQELGQEKSRYQLLERSTKDQVTNQTQEIKALQVRMQHSHEQHLTETSALQTKLQQAAKDDANNQLKLQEEIKQLQDSMTKLENENKVASSHEINRLQQELKKIKSEKEEFENKLSKTHSSQKELEEKISEYEERIEKLQKTQKEEETSRIKHDNKLMEDLKRAESQKNSLSDDLKNMETTKKNMEKDNAALKSRLKQLEDSNSAESEKLKVSEKALLDVRDKVQMLKTQVNELTNQQVSKDQEIQDLREENENLAAQVSASQRAAAEGQEDVSNEDEDQPVGKPNGDIHYEELVDKVKLALVEQENIVIEKSKLIEELHEELRNHKTEVTRLAEEVEQLKKKNNDLREKNWKAMDAVSAAEKTAEQKLNATIKMSQEKEEKYLVEQEECTKKLLQRIFPDIHINCKNRESWLGEFEKEAIETIARYSSQTVSQDVLNQLSEAESNQSKLHTQVQHYKKVLEETEGILNKLQNSVEAEEKKWQEKLSILTSELDQVKAEKKVLEDSLVHIKAAEEMEIKLRELQHKLEGEELERRVLQEKHNFAIERATVLEESLATFQKEIDNLKQQNANTEATQKELAELKNHLEKEKKTNKDLNSQVVKLNSLVKIGQDSLKLEQDVVKKLQEQLQDKAVEAVPVEDNTSCPEVEEDSSVSSVKSGTSV